MSTLAVFIALGGSSYAALEISGSSIKNRSIPAKKLKRNSITGREVRESRLNVPWARRAERLGGLTADQLRIHCPSDTFPIADVCVERTPRSPAAYSSAVHRVLRRRYAGRPRAAAADARRAPSRARRP